MQRDAEAHAEEDKKAKEAIEIKNNADNLAYQCEKQLKDLGDKISGDKKKQVEDAIAAVREALKGNDTDAMKRTYDDLQNKFQEISAELYKQAVSAVPVRTRCRARAGSATAAGRRRTKAPVRASGKATSSMRSSKSSTTTRSNINNQFAGRLLGKFFERAAGNNQQTKRSDNNNYGNLT